MTITSIKKIQPSNRRFVDTQPRRYRAVPQILKSMAELTTEAIANECGTKHPKIREVKVEVDYKGQTPLARVSSRYYRKWSKVAEFPIDPTGGFGFAPVPASR